MLNKLHGVLGTVLAILMALLVGAVTWQVVSRYLLNAPSAWTEEAARFLLIWISVLGAAHAYRSRAHLAIDLLPNKLGARGGARLEVLSAVLVAVFAVAVMLVGGGRLVHITWELNQISPALALPMALIYSVVPISGGLIFLFAVERLGGESRLIFRDTSGQTMTVTGELRDD